MKKTSPPDFLHSTEDYLGKASQEAICVKGQEKTQINTIDPSFLDLIRVYLKKRGLRYQGAINEALVARENGKVFSTTDHVKALIYTLISNHTQWYRIEPHLEEIAKIFHNYNIDEIRNDGAFYSNALFSIRCGNISTKNQMASLFANLTQLRRIIDEFGSMEAFVLSKPAPEVAALLSKAGSSYKLKYIGEALAWEYLRNVGIDGSKPDTHLRRFFGSERMGASNKKEASPSEVYSVVSQLAEKTDYKFFEIDNLIWSYCADGYGEVCTSTPRCSDCPISHYCKMRKCGGLSKIR